MKPHLKLIEKFTMSVGYFAASLSDIGLVLEILKKQQLLKLYVEVVGNVHSSASLTETVCAKICQTYSQAASIQENVNLNINIEYLKRSQPGNLAVNPDVVFVKEGSTVPLTSVPVVTVRNSTRENLILEESKPIQLHGNVVLGGTFDRLHVGHKILLTEAAMRCNKKLTVGVTDESMVKNKKLYELIEPVETRIKSVQEFLRNIDKTIVHDVVPISDMFGPTRTDPDLDMLVVSTETLRGGYKVNEVRAAAGFKQLELYTIPLVESSEKGEADEDKVSSSNQRLRLLGTRLRQPVPKPNLPARPYLIGLTGCIASGKSNVGKTLSAKGVPVIDCDKVAHSLYTKGSDTYEAVINTFGPNVIGEDGEINRKALGAIVFSSPVELEKLNNLLWPAILEASLAEANRLYREGNDIIVLEAAVLLRAGWHNSVHEVWTCVVPPEEAVQRVMDRNKLTKDEAEARLKNQPSNSDQVAIANVVFCSLYSYEYTKSQVDKAWELLLKYLEQERPLSKC